MKKKYIWTCDYCGKEFATKKESDYHESNCIKNPKYKEIVFKVKKPTLKSSFLAILVLIGVYLFITSTSSSGNSNKIYVNPTPSGNEGCSRTNPYSIPPEFQRALSLMIQRLKSPSLFTQQSTGSSINPEVMKLLSNHGNKIDQIQNCLDIQYSKNDTDMEGANGYFLYTDNQSTDDLKIIVSPKYQATDDLLTSLLLLHEVTHAIQFVDGKITGKPLDCVEKEVIAYQMSFSFFSLLNQEEINSLFARYQKRTSPDVNNYFDTMMGTNKFKGNDVVEKLRNLIKSEPYYQKQCNLN